MAQVATSDMRLEFYYEQALGALGMTVDEFENMRLRNFFLKLRGYQLNEYRRYREQAELVRLQTLTLFNVQVNSKDRIKQPAELWRFPWEADGLDEMEAPQLTEEQAQTNLKRLIEYGERSNIGAKS